MSIGVLYVKSDGTGFRSSLIADSDDILRSFPADANRMELLQTCISAKGRTKTVRMGKGCIKAIAKYRQDRGLAPRDNVSLMSPASNAIQISASAAAATDAVTTGTTNITFCCHGTMLFLLFGRMTCVKHCCCLIEGIDSVIHPVQSLFIHWD